MTKGAIFLGAAALALCACGRSADQRDAQHPTNSTVQNVVDATANTEPAADSTPLNEPNGSIDPKSAEAAGQLVQRYGALVEQKRWAEANALWGDAASAAEFEGKLAQFAQVHLEIGNPGDPEGAAGSIYVTMPVILYGDQLDGQPFRRAGEAALRRVNDVPGSTEAQRHWHIERIDLAS
jgi:hypothetical protein